MSFVVRFYFHSTLQSKLLFNNSEEMYNILHYKRVKNIVYYEIYVFNMHTNILHVGCKDKILA